jgi:Protein of unknown function (DUF2971)
MGPEEDIGEKYSRYLIEGLLASFPPDVRGALLPRLLSSNLLPEFPVKRLPKLLYHYTDSAGLIGILDTQELWATHADYLNDSREMQYGRDLIVSELDSARNNAPTESAQSCLEQTALCITVGNPDFDHYLVCFCEKGDLLSQWRGYGDRGAGYAIGFDLLEFMKLVGLPQPVVYEPRRQRRDVSLLASMTVAAIDGYADLTGNVLSEQEIRDAAADLAAALSTEYVARFKSPHFKEEKEWRQIIVEYPNRETPSLAPTCFRSNSSMPIPFKKVSPRNLHEGGQPLLPVRQVVVGPTAHPSLAAKSIEMMIRMRGYDAPTPRVVPSKVSLR